MIATFLADAFRGKILLLFFRSTIDSPLASLAKVWCLALSTTIPCWWLSLALSVMARVSMTISSNFDSDKVPFLTASTIFLLLKPPLAGISKFKPAATPKGRSLTAPQSDTTKPWKPHFFFKISVSKYSFSEAYTPLSLLYEHITVQGWASFTAISKAGK